MEVSLTCSTKIEHPSPLTPSAAAPAAKSKRCELRLSSVTLNLSGSWPCEILEAGTTRYQPTLILLPLKLRRAFLGHGGDALFSIFSCPRVGLVFRFDFNCRV